MSRGCPPTGIQVGPPLIASAMGVREAVSTANTWGRGTRVPVPVRKRRQDGGLHPAGPFPGEDLPPPEALFRALAVHRSPESAALKPEPQGSRGRPRVRKAPSTARPRPRSSRRALLSEKEGRSGALPRGSRAYPSAICRAPRLAHACSPARGLPAALLARLGPVRSRCSPLALLHASAPTTSRWRKC